MNSPKDTKRKPVVYIVDDDDGMRRATTVLISTVGYQPVAFAKPSEFLAKYDRNQPSCLVLDVRMPGSSGLDLQQHLAAAGDSKPIVFLTGHGDIPMTVQAMKAGAVDFLTKPFRDQSLLDAVSTGIERDIAQRADARMVQQQADRYALLTARERQVLRLVAQGRLNKQIAFDLGITEVTVKLHRSGVMKKMQAVSVGELVRAWDLLPAELRERVT